MFAAIVGQVEITRLLLKGSSDKEVKDTNSKTVLSWTKKEGKTEIERLFTGNLDEVITVDNTRPTPLYQALESGQFNIANDLLAKGTNVNALD